MSREDGRAWVIPLAALIGFQVGCNAVAGRGPLLKPLSDGVIGIPGSHRLDPAALLIAEEHRTPLGHGSGGGCTTIDGSEAGSWIQRQLDLDQRTEELSCGRQWGASQRHPSTTISSMVVVS
jgi:hypothetical protein